MVSISGNLQGSVRIGAIVVEKQELFKMLIARLERLSADSYWAHQACGVRGSLLRLMESGELDSSRASILLEKGFEFLEKAAKEV